MLSAAELRKFQYENVAARTEQKSKREAELKSRFIEACTDYREVILAEVKSALEFVREKRPDYKFIMLNHASLIKDVKGFSYTTLLYGFWNKEKGAFDESIFKQHDTVKPFDLAAFELEALEGFSYTTLLYGFWNKEKGAFDESIFKQHDTAKPFDLAAFELEALGYKLENVSDPTRSKRLYVKLSWTE